MKSSTRLRIADIEIDLFGDSKATLLFRQRYGAFLAPRSALPAASTIVFDLAGQPGASWTGEPMQLARTGDEIELRSEGFHATIAADGARASVSAPLAERSVDGVLRYILAQRLLESRALLLHASAVVIGAGAWLFIGPSGAGKTTLASSLCGAILGDEAIALRRDGAHLVAHATPYWRSEQARAQVAGIFFIGRGEANCITALSSARTLAGLIKNAGPILPGNEDHSMQSAMHLIGALPAPAATLTLRSIPAIGNWLQPKLQPVPSHEMVGSTDGG